MEFHIKRELTFRNLTRRTEEDGIRRCEEKLHRFEIRFPSNEPVSASFALVLFVLFFIKYIFTWERENAMRRNTQEQMVRERAVKNICE